MPKKVPVRDKPKPLNNLESFAEAIQKRLESGEKSGGPFAMQRLVCRLLNSRDERVAMAMVAKWTEWRFGKAPQPNTHANANGEPFKVIFE